MIIIIINNCNKANKPQQIHKKKTLVDSTDLIGELERFHPGLEKQWNTFSTQQTE